MSSISTISRSGMNAAQAALDVSAHNIAHLSAAGFRRTQATQSTAAEGGVATSVSRAARGGHALETDLVDQFTAQHRFLANLAVFKANDRMLGALLDATS